MEKLKKAYHLNILTKQVEYIQKKSLLSETEGLVPYWKKSLHVTTITRFEFINTTSSIYELYNTCEEWMGFV